MRYILLALLVVLFTSPACAEETFIDGSPVTITEAALNVGHALTAIAAELALYDGDGEKVTITVPDLSADYQLTLPTNDGASGEQLTTDGAGVLTWQAAGGAGSGITQLTGDVTAGPGSGSQAATIPNDTVTFAKTQNISTDRILGRDTAGAGDIEELTLGAGLSISGGALLVAAGVSGSGTDNHVTRWDGTGAIQDSGWVLDDTDNLAAAEGTLSVTSTASGAVVVTVLASTTGEKGILAEAQDSSGVEGHSITGEGVVGSGDQAGVHGTSTGAGPGVWGEGSTGVGVLAETASSANGVYGLSADRSQLGDWADVNEVATPATPPTGASRAYVQSDGYFYGKSDAGKITPLSNIVKQTEIDWGTNAAGDTFMTFTVTDTDVTTTDRIECWLSYEAPTGRDLDELEGYAFSFSTVAGSGSFTIAAQSLLGIADGKFKVNYSIGGQY